MNENTQSANHKSLSIEMTTREGKRVTKSFSGGSDLYNFWESNRTRRPGEGKTKGESEKN
jgi:hypothetical protein